MALLDEVQQHLGSNEVSQIAQQLGVNQSQAQSAISSALPALVGGMAGHASQPAGADSVQQAVNSHAGATNNVSRLLSTGGTADTSGLLSNILGGHRDTVREHVEQSSGLDSEKSRKLLMMLAPIVLGVLARKHVGQVTAAGGEQQHEAGGGLGGLLRNEAQSAAQRSPQMGGLLGKILGGAQANG